MRELFNRPLRVLVVTNSLILVAGAMLGPIYALFVEKVGGSLFDASLAFGIFALAAGVTVLISGHLTDKYQEHELIMVIGYVVMGIGFILLIFVNSIWFLFLVQALIGIGEAIYTPAFDAVYSDHVDEGKSARQWGIWESMYYFAGAFGAILGGYIVTQFGFTTIFLIMALLAFGSALYIYFLPRKVL